jgi:hypothetical protein
MKQNLITNQKDPEKQILARVGRRFFLRSAGLATATGVFILGACTDHDIEGDNTVYLGEGDFGILNYAYALEQLEAAFYTKVLESEYMGMTNEERSILTDIRDHEIVHREFFKAALGSNAIKNLTPNFTTIDFTSRTSVLGAAVIFEDTGVSAYNGAGMYIQNGEYLLIAGKIVSVEARHAAVVRDLAAPTRFTAAFADDMIVDTTNGFDLAQDPSFILNKVKGYVLETINGSSLA